MKNKVQHTPGPWIINHTSLQRPLGDPDLLSMLSRLCAIIDEASGIPNYFREASDNERMMTAVILELSNQGKRIIKQVKGE